MKDKKLNSISICCSFLSLILIASSGQTINHTADTDVISFSGYDWFVKTTSDSAGGPGPNYFSDSLENVWVDANGSLHLRITYDNTSEKWYCAEVYTVDSFGYGTYQFTLAPGFENLDKNVVLGLFTYLDDNNEIDIEFARWGDVSAENGQYVLQPSWLANHVKRFEFNPQGLDSTHSFTWCKNTIDFNSTNGADEEFLWRYYGTGIPKPDVEKARMNLWLRGGLPPSDSLETEVIIKSFEFIPSECLNQPIGFWWVIIISLVGVASLLTPAIIFIAKRRRY